MCVQFYFAGLLGSERSCSSNSSSMQHDHSLTIRRDYFRFLFFLHLLFCTLFNSAHINHFDLDVVEEDVPTDDDNGTETLK